MVKKWYNLRVNSILDKDLRKETRSFYKEIRIQICYNWTNIIEISYKTIDHPVHYELIMENIKRIYKTSKKVYLKFIKHKDFICLNDYIDILI